MDSQTQVAIISVFGRGLWLAAELAKKNIPVTVLDVSAQMGPWKSEDAMGPFGAFSTAQPALQAVLGAESLTEVPRGLTVWLPSGPLEFRGPNIEHCLASLEIPESVVQYLRDENLKKASQLSAQNLKAIEAAPFRQNWIAQLAHAWASKVATLSTEALRESAKRNLFSAFFLPAHHAQFLPLSLNWCDAQSVQVLRDVELKDLSLLEKGHVAGLEIRTSKPGIFKAEQFVFCLTSQEAGRIQPRIQKALFGDDVASPEWVWMRYQIQVKNQIRDQAWTRDQLPIHFILIVDLQLPWSHENLMIWQKKFSSAGPSSPSNDTENTDTENTDYDVWIKIPNAHRFQKQYLQDQAELICQAMKERLPECQLKIQALPLEAELNFEQTGPARQPVYSRTVKVLRPDFHQANQFFHSPEVWSHLAFEAQLEHEEKIRDHLLLWWSAKEELRLKREAREQAKIQNQGANP